MLPLILALVASPSLAEEWRVVGGHRADPGDWPDAVAVYAGDDYRCSGTLVAPDVVLTAAHCDWGLTHVVLDTIDHAGGGEVIDIAWTRSHAQAWTTYDVALLVLEQSSTVAPRPIAYDCLVDDWLADGAPVAIVGFGALDPWASGDNTELYEATTTVVDHDCSSIERGCNAGVSPGGELIAGGEGIDSCNGDSGGPLYLLGDDQAYLVGVTSRATTDADVLCGDGGIYVRPDAVVAWIEQEADVDLPDPDCSDRVNHPPDPVATPVWVKPGFSAISYVDPVDPDPEDHHTWEVASPPVHGTVEVLTDGRLRYTPGPGHHGPDSFVVRVEDDGLPPLAASVEVPVTVARVQVERGGCGCGGGGGTGAWALLALAAFRRRRG